MRIGFSLIELLIVISLIAILAAILFPIFSKAREKASQTNCLSNQRQIAMGVMIYAQDNDDMLPANLGVLGLPPNALKCNNSTASLAYSLANDLAAARLASFSSNNAADTVLTADGAVNNFVLTNNGRIISKQDIALNIHGNNGFIASFLDSHVAYENSMTNPLYDAIDLTNAQTHAISSNGSTSANSILYMGAQNVYTFDASSDHGILTGQTFTSTTPMAVQYVTIKMINVPTSGYPVPTISVSTTSTGTPPVITTVPNVVIFSSLQSNTYYTFTVNPTAGVAQTVTGIVNGTDLALTIN